MSGRTGTGEESGHSARFTFWLTFFKSCILPLFFSGLLSYLVGMKRRTSRHVTYKSDDSSFPFMYLSPLTSQVYLLFNPFFKDICYLLQWIAFIFGRDEEGDQ